MSYEDKKIASCDGKRKLKRVQAKEAARAMRRAGKKVAPYKCPFCHQWHVGDPGEKTARIKAVEYAEVWTPRPEKERDRPTPERQEKGDWVFVTTEKAGVKAAMDKNAHPIDRMEHAGVLSNDQASAARDFEDLYRAANDSGDVRDSTTIWEPKGHDNGDGNVKAARDRKELYLFLGPARDQLLRRLCVEAKEPRHYQIGLVREALNECCRFFKK